MNIIGMTTWQHGGTAAASMNNVAPNRQTKLVKITKRATITDVAGAYRGGGRSDAAGR
jgi:hypothetical protein